MDAEKADHLTPRSTYSQVAPPAIGIDAMTDWLVGVKRENDDLRHENQELVALVEEARSLASEAEDVRNGAELGVARHELEGKISSQHTDIIQRASSVCGSRPGSAGSSRFSVMQYAVPASAKCWKRPTEKPISRPASRPTSAASSRPGYANVAPSIVDSNYGFVSGLDAIPGSPTSPKMGGVARIFHVQLDRSIGGSLGMKIRSSGCMLEVTKIKDEGLVSMWNVANPSLAILKGDRIAEVNGKRGNAEELLNECTQPIFLRFIVETKRERAPDDAMSRASSKHVGPKPPTVAQWCHARILRLLYQHDCEVIAQLDKIMEQFRGREPTLYEAMCSKYGVEPEAYDDEQN